MEIKAQDQLIRKLANPGALEKAFFQFLNDAGLNIRFAINNKTVADGAFMHAQIVAALTSVEYFTGSTDTEYTNQDTFIRPEGEHAVIYGIRLSDTTTAANINASDWATGVNAISTQNGFIEISVNGVQQLPKISLTEFIGVPEETESGRYYLIKPIVWGEQTRMKLTLTFEVAPAANSKVMVELLVLTLI